MDEQLTRGDVIQLMAYFHGGWSLGAFPEKSYWNPATLLATAKNCRELAALPGCSSLPIPGGNSRQRPIELEQLADGLNRLAELCRAAQTDPPDWRGLWPRIATSMKGLQDSADTLWEGTKKQLARGGRMRAGGNGSSQVEGNLTAERIAKLLSMIHRWVRPSYLLKLVGDFLTRPEEYSELVEFSQTLAPDVVLPFRLPPEASDFAAWLLTQERSTQQIITDFMLVGPFHHRILAIAAALHRARLWKEKLASRDEGRSGELQERIRAYLASLSGPAEARLREVLVSQVFAEVLSGAGARTPPSSQRALTGSHPPAVAAPIREQPEPERTTAAMRGILHALWKGRDHLAHARTVYQADIKLTWRSPAGQDRRLSEQFWNLDSVPETILASLEAGRKVEMESEEDREGAARDESQASMSWMEMQAWTAWHHLAGDHVLRQGRTEQLLREPRRRTWLLEPDTPANASLPEPDQQRLMEAKATLKKVLARVRDLLAPVFGRNGRQRRPQAMEEYLKDLQRAVDEHWRPAARKTGQSGNGKMIGRSRIKKALREAFLKKAAAARDELQRHANEPESTLDPLVRENVGKLVRRLDQLLAHEDLDDIIRALAQEGEDGQALASALSSTRDPHTRRLPAFLKFAKKIPEYVAIRSALTSDLGSDHRTDTLRSIDRAVHAVFDYVAGFGKLIGKDAGLIALVPAHLSLGNLNDWLFIDTLDTLAAPASLSAEADPTGG